MARRPEPLSAADIAAIAVRAEDMSFDLHAASIAMEKRFTPDPGDAIEALRQLARLAECAMALSRTIAGSAKMNNSLSGLERRLEDRLKQQPPPLAKSESGGTINEHDPDQN